MKDFSGRIAVVTGGGSGIGRELVRELVAEGCTVAMCDLSEDGMAETVRLCGAIGATRLSTHVVDVSNESDVLRFRDEVAHRFSTTKIHLLFNNAGIAGGGSFVCSDRADWERTFNVCWGGVYHCTRHFLDMLMAADCSHITNVSSVNALWAALMPGKAWTAYSAAKFAVRGFTESLILDLQQNAPHVGCSLVLPGYVGTSIVANSKKALDGLSARGSDTHQAASREHARSLGIDVGRLPSGAIPAAISQLSQRYASGGVTPAGAAKEILDGVRAGRWRILIGADARLMDEMVRAAPDEAYSPIFIKRMTDAVSRIDIRDR